LPAFKTFTLAEVLLWAATPLVVAAMALAFSALAEILGRKRGYLAGFALYWIGFGILFPLVVVGPERLLATLRPAPLPAGVAGVALGILLLLPPLGAGWYVFRTRLADATAAVIAASLGLALINALAEELLWRASYAVVFHDNVVLGLALPALGFAVWHLAPQIVLPSRQPGGAVTFVAASFVLGLLWGTVAWTTGSVFWTFLSHAATDFLGLGGFAYLATRRGAPPLLDAPAAD
jgi:membrane protease YdiL (CAAX protease family)